MKNQIKTIHLKGGYIKTKSKDIETENMIINQGCGVHKNKKGKGSYSRKSKHNKKTEISYCAY